MSKIDINVHLVTRVEGHGNIIAKMDDGKVKEVTWEVTEAPRLFESFIRGRRWDEIHHITSRICGICSVSHQLVSLQATEAAFGITPSEQTRLLRRLLYVGEMIESHILHVYFLVAPDLVGVGSVFPLIETHTDVVLRALRLKKLGNDIMDIIGGRAVHPNSTMVNGFGRLPSKQNLEGIKERLEASMEDLVATVELLKGFTLPDFTRETEFIALTDPDEYAIVHGFLSSTDTGIAPLNKYLEFTNEFCVPQSTAKWTKHARESYAVGALARINNNYEQLHPAAKGVAEALGLKPVCHNPFMNSIAQVAETVHEVMVGIDVIDQLLRMGVKEEEIVVNPKAGRGIGAVEAPRGLLIHDYTYDDNGYITEANCIIPTNQNHNSIQHDLEELVPKFSNKSEDEIRLLCEMLVRSYDPCISCSCHMLRLEQK
ncbi:Ni/Fe hydrogenase subunit alpha [Chloroflexota bacterium]